MGAVEGEGNRYYEIECYLRDLRVVLYFLLRLPPFFLVLGASEPCFNPPKPGGNSDGIA